MTTVSSFFYVFSTFDGLMIWKVSFFQFFLFLFCRSEADNLFREHKLLNTLYYNVCCNKNKNVISLLFKAIPLRLITRQI